MNLKTVTVLKVISQGYEQVFWLITASNIIKLTSKKSPSLQIQIQVQVYSLDDITDTTICSLAVEKMVHHISKYR